MIKTKKQNNKQYYKKHKEYITQINNEYKIRANMSQFYTGFVIPTLKKLRGNKCEKCDSNRSLDIHHSDYNNININTLHLLCRKCHKELHS